MRPESTARASLFAVIRHDLAAMRDMDAQVASLRPALAPDGATFRDLAAAGYLLHNLYNALENSLEQIARTFENHIVDASQWHRELLDKMFLDIPGVRPPVLPGSLRQMLHDLRGFRHIFRHSYDFQLDPGRLSRLVANWDSGKEELFRSLEIFSDSLLKGS